MSPPKIGSDASKGPLQELSLTCVPRTEEALNSDTTDLQGMFNNEQQHALPGSIPKI